MTKCSQSDRSNEFDSSYLEFFVKLKINKKLSCGVTCGGLPMLMFIPSIRRQPGAGVCQNVNLWFYNQDRLGFARRVFTRACKYREGNRTP